MIVKIRDFAYVLAIDNMLTSRNGDHFGDLITSLQFAVIETVRNAKWFRLSESGKAPNRSIK